jgi:hypothetical protein
MIDMPIEMIAFDAPFFSKAGLVYSLPAQTKFLTWYSLIGSDLQTSMDGVNFVTIDTVTAGAVGKNVANHGSFIRTSADSWIVARGRF